jgi:cbb3-type cytochrome oxidase subunit 3
MSTGRNFARTWGRGLAVFVMVLIGALVVLFAYRRGAPKLSDAAPEAAPTRVEQATPAPVRSPAPAAELATKTQTAVPADPYAGMYAGPGPDDPAGPGMLPHPITPEHLRLYRDVELLDGAWQALKNHDFQQARVLLRQHASEYGSAGYDDLNDGLTLLADCMEHPSATTRARAQRFYDERTASTARRKIRNHCLQGTELTNSRFAENTHLRP